MIKEPRNGHWINLLVLHDPEGANTAQELYDYLQKIDAGYHWLFDDTETIIAATDDLILEAAGGVNSHSLSGCVVPGFVAWPRETWLSHSAALLRAAEFFAVKCVFYGIPVVRLTPAQVLASDADPNVRGICGHGDVSPFHPTSDGHTDPGPNFPWDLFLATADAIVSPPKPTNPWVAVLKALPGWTVQRRDRGVKVTRVQRMLNGHNFHLLVNGVYDQPMADAVLRFKKSHGLRNRNPNKVGVACLIALLKAPKK